MYLPLYFDMKMFIKLAVKIPAVKHSIAVHKPAIAVVTLFVPMEHKINVNNYQRVLSISIDDH